MLRYKTCNLEMDISNKSDRVEWGHLRYQGLFFPDATLEFIFQWGVCTGPLVAELIQNWLRKAQNCGVNLVPIPCDPFALPMSHKADPLRAPIFVPLDLNSLNDEDQHFLHDFPQKSWPQRILLFQVSHFFISLLFFYRKSINVSCLQRSIAHHFGFLPCSPDPASPTALSSSIHKSLPPLQFIHSSGTGFLLILNPEDRESVPPSPQRSQRSSSTWAPSSLPGSAVLSPTDTGIGSYITRHVVGRQKWQQNQEIRVGYLWAWNSMLSKRWRNPSGPSGDESTPTRTLSEFRKFCANDQGRLTKFWNQARQQVYPTEMPS